MGIWNECFDKPDFGDCTLMPSNKIIPTKKPTPPKTSVSDREEDDGKKTKNVRIYREDITPGTSDLS